MSLVVEASWGTLKPLEEKEGGIGTVLEALCQSLIGKDLSDVTLALWMMGMSEPLHVPHDYKSGCVQSSHNIDGFYGSTCEHEFTSSDKLSIILRTDDGYEESVCEGD